MALVVDSGPLIALLDATEADHDAYATLLQGASEALVVPVCVLVEVEYLLRRWSAAFDALLREFAAGSFELLSLTTPWLLRAGDFVAQYRDLPLGLVDATVFAAAEMLNETRVATLDRRHFTTVRPVHVDALSLVP
jgi:predicted nucleic acid-binding protein